MKAGGVIYAVSHIAHHVSVFPKSVHHSLLLHRRETGENVFFLYNTRKLFLTHLFQVGAGYRILFSYLHAYQLTYVLHHNGGIAGNDLYLYACIIQSVNGFLGIRLGRIQEGNNAQEGHIRFVLRMENSGVSCIFPLCGNSNDVHSLMI